MKKIASGGGLLALALLLGTLTAAAALAWLSQAGQSRGGAAVSDQQPRTVVVAKVEVSAGTRLTAAMMETRQVSQGAALAGTPASPEELVGRALRYPLIAGEQVSEAKLVPESAKNAAGLAFAVPAGMRAVAISVNEVSGAGGLIVPGDRVDVMVHTEYERLFGPTDARTVARDEKRHPTVLTVLQDLLVIAVGQQTTPPNDAKRDAATLRTEDAKAQPAAKSVTLALTPAQTQVLFLAAHEGAIGLALRSFGDTASSTLAPLVRLESLGGPAVPSAPIAAPAPTPTPPATTAGAPAAGTPLGR